MLKEIKKLEYEIALLGLPEKDLTGVSIRLMDLHKAIAISNLDRLKTIDIELESEKIDPFSARYDNFQIEYDLFLDWCLDVKKPMNEIEWLKMRAIEFKNRGLHNFFNK